MKSLLVDFNNIAVSKLFSRNVMKREGYDVKDVDYRAWEYGVFSSIYSYFSKYKNVKEIVLAIDNKQTWRKLYFPRYKEHRKKAKDKFNIDWNEYNRNFLSYIKELQTHFPFKILDLKYCEGDDIIGAIALKNRDKEFIIISSDQDYLQLCRNGVKLFSIQKQQEMSHPNPEMFLKESSLIGQQKDNIFNVLTPLDYPAELRKPAMGKKKAEKFLIEGLEKALDKDVEYKRKFIGEDGEQKVYNSCINLKERYDFNRNLMDFSKIPKSLVKSIISKYENYEYPHPENIYKFFEMKGWPWFLDNITNIENKLYQLYESEKRKD